MQLIKKLHTVNEGLKKFAHVNKKAFEQYNNFTKQRDQLLSRREELDTSAKSIEELISVLDMRKDEAIERTFKQVAKNFEEVFEKLARADVRERELLSFVAHCGGRFLGVSVGTNVI